MGKGTDTGSRILRRTVTRNGRRLGVGTALISLHQLCEAAVPVAIGVGIDRAVAPGDGTALIVWVLALAGLFTVLTVVYRFGARQLMLAIAHEGHRLRGELATRIMDARGIRTDLRAGDLLTVSSTDADNGSYLLDYVPRIAGALTATVAAGITLLLIDVPLGLAVLVGTPLVLVVLQVSAPLITRRVADQQAAAGRATSLATDLVSGLRPLRGIGAETNAARRYREVSQASLRASLRAARTQSTYLAASSTVSGLLACGVAVLAGWFALDGRISIGEFITVIGLAQFLIEPAGFLAIVPSHIAEARASAGRAALVLDAPYVRDEPVPHEPAGLALRGIRCGPLAGLDLHLAPGEFVGVVAHRSVDGETLVNLLSGRFGREEYEGELRVGGLLVEPHHTDLFTGTIASNLRPAPSPDGPGELDDPGGLDAALAASAAAQVVDAHPDGLAHVVAERGASLSGGQRQRLALARALLARAPVLVLHDPTTAVDAVTEHAIARGIRALRHPGGDDRYATLVVTSSPALLAETDRVVVLDGGRIVADGVHHELTADDARYRQAVLR